MEALALRPVVDDHVTVVGDVEQRPVRARVAAAGVAAPVPDQVDADVPGFFPGGDGAGAAVVGNQVRERRLQAPDVRERQQEVGADDAVGIVRDAAVEPAFAAARSRACGSRARYWSTDWNACGRFVFVRR